MPRQQTPPKTKPTNKADAILCADLHLSPRVPKCRSEEEYVPAMLKKLEFIRDLQEQHGGIPVLCAGDVVDKWYLDKGEQWFVTQIIQLMNNWIAIPGQHDLPQHNVELYDKSWLATLEEANCIEVFEEPHIYKMLNREGVFNSIYTLPWGTEPTGCVKEDTHTIALIHRMVYQGKPPYPGAEKDGGAAKSLMRKMKGFDLIVSGDNHETFVEEIGDRLLVNPGSMMRTSAKQIDHEPSVFFWYAEGNTVERVALPYDRHAVSREHIERTEKHDSRMQAFVEKLEGEVDLSVGFKENVIKRIKESKVNKGTKEIIMEVVG